MDIGAFVQRSLWQWIEKGGWVMYPLLLMSMISLYLIIWRVVMLFRSKINTNEFVRRVRDSMLSGDIENAIRICEDKKYRGPVAAIVKVGLLKHDSPKEEVEKTVEFCSMMTVTPCSW